MIKMSDILALTESGTGFVGGACVDTMPHLTLTECVGEMNIAILESHIADTVSDQKQTEALVESTLSAMSTGTQIDVDALMEASFADIKAKVKRFFNRIVAFLKSIVAKLTVEIDKIRLSGKQLYAKYKDSKLLNKDFTGLTFNGYKFPKDLSKMFSAGAKYETDVDALVKTALSGDSAISPKEFRAKFYHGAFTAKSEQETAAKKIVDGIKDTEGAERVYGMIKAISGESSISKDSWKADLKKIAYGGDEKTEMKYGTDWNLDAIRALLENPTDLDHIKEDYKRIAVACEKYKSEVERELDEMTKDFKDSNDEQKNFLSVATGFYNAYMSVIKDAYGAINGVKSVKMDACRMQNAQAKKMFGKMLSYKKPKDESASFDDASMLEFDIEL